MRLAEKIRLDNFSSQTGAASFAISRHAARLFTRICLGLERFCIRYSNTEPKLTAGYFATRARLTSDTHLLRHAAFRRERASNLILDAQICRVVATRINEREALDNAMKYLYEAGRMLQEVDSEARVHIRYQIEISKVCRKLAKFHRNSGDITGISPKIIYEHQSLSKSFCMQARRALNLGSKLVKVDFAKSSASQHWSQMINLQEHLLESEETAQKLVPLAN